MDERYQSTWRHQFGRSLPALLAVYLPVFGALFTLVVVSRQTGIPVSHFTRDPSAVMEATFYVGALSNIGALLWCSAAAVCLFSFLVLRSDTRNREMALFLLCSGLITSMLLVDDLFLLHERVFPWHLHIPEKAVLGVYGIVVLLYFVRFRESILRTDFLFLLLAFGFFALSIIVDRVPESVIPEHHLFEDGFKLFGIVSWWAYFTGVCLKQVGRRV